MIADDGAKEKVYLMLIIFIINKYISIIYASFMVDNYV